MDVSLLIESTVNTAEGCVGGGGGDGGHLAVWDQGDEGVI